jgi:TonB family protein
VFGAPDLVPETDLERIEARLANLPDIAEEELPWPLGGDTRTTFFINERVSPRGTSWRDGSIWLTLVISILFHLLVFSQLMKGSAISTMMAALQPPPRRAQVEEPVWPRFQLVDLPNQKEEKPSRRNAPGSDLDRRAHGGVGAPADQPGSQGNTPEQRMQAPAAGTAGGSSGTEGVKVAGKGEEGEGAGRGAKTGEGEGASPTPPIQVADAGGEALRQPFQGGGQNRPVLRGIGGLGPGSIGGSVPNRKGGRVDMGPLSFDTNWYEWGPYAAEMLRKIRYHWRIPEIAQLGVGGVVRIRFFIERDGRVTGLEIEMPSAHPPMDYAARDAILNASPLNPLPADLVGVEREGVTITFYYNTPIPEDA